MYILNQEVFDHAPQISVENRGFLYGEYCFTSFLVYKHVILQQSSHIQRLLKSSTIVFNEDEISTLDLVDHFNLLKKHCPNSHRARVNILKIGDKLSIMSSIKPIHNCFFSSTQSSLEEVVAYEFISPHHSSFGEIKFPSYARELILRRGAKDFIKYDENKLISEMSTSNLVFKKGSNFYIPKGKYFKGISLELFQKFLRKNKLKEKEICLDTVSEYDGIISLNSVKVFTQIRKINGENISICDKTFIEFKEFILKEYQSAGSI